MKYIQLLTLLIVFLLISCVREYETTTTFYFTNSCSRELTLFISNFEKPGFYTIVDTNFQLSPQETFHFSYYYDGVGDFIPTPFGPYSDSATINFEDTISVSYLKDDPNERNPLNINSYTGGKESSSCKTCDIYKYYYTITEEDYENALATY